MSCPQEFCRSLKLYFTANGDPVTYVTVRKERWGNWRSGALCNNAEGEVGQWPYLQGSNSVCWQIRTLELQLLQFSCAGNDDDIF